MCRAPDAILLDARLPDVTGLMLTERLRANPDTASSPLIVLTGSDEADAQAQRLRSELTGVPMKPCPADQLLTAVLQAIKRRV